MSVVALIRAARVDDANPHGTMTVVGADGLAIPDAEQWLNYLRTVRASPNTVSAYARHLALFLRWLSGRGTHWERLDFEGLCLFVQDLSDGTVPALASATRLRPPRPRSKSTVEAILAAIYSFYDYWRIEGRGPDGLILYRTARTQGRTPYHFLAHVESRRHRIERRVKVRGPKTQLPAIIQFEDDFLKLLSACNTHRDKLLLSACYDGGLRIGQALGLRHEDLDIARRRVTVTRRENNINRALSKQRDTFSVSMPERFFEFYGDALTEEQLAADIDSDYVFVNLSGSPRGRPMSYKNAAQRMSGIGKRAGVRITPHILRHTHGTALAKQGWSGPEIAKRLGQTASSSADVYIHLAQEDIAVKYQETFTRLVPNQ